MKKYSLLLRIQARDRKIIGGFILLAVFGALCISIFPSQFKNLIAIKKQFKYQTNLIKAREFKTARLLSIKEEYSRLMNEVKETHNMFFNSEESVDFLRSISDLAERRTDNNLLLMEPQAEKTIEPSFIDKDKGLAYRKKIVDLSLEGSFRSIEDLIKRFDNNKNLLGIEKARLKYEPSISGIKARIGLAMYILTEGETGRTSR